MATLLAVVTFNVLLVGFGGKCFFLVRFLVRRSYFIGEDLGTRIVEVV